MKKIDYRIINTNHILSAYNALIENQNHRKSQGNLNEFEPKLMSLEEISAELEFQIQSVVIVFMPYMTKNKLLSYSSSNLSVHAQSLDYHVICKILLQKLVTTLDLENSNNYLQVDQGLFNERFFAIHTGLCMKSINQLAIHPRYGSYGFLGIIATDKKLVEIVDETKNCSKCMACQKACPANAIRETEMKRNQCISYLTQKKELKNSDQKIIKRGTKAYGCDVCQIVCPENNNIKMSEIEDFNLDLMYNIDLRDIDSISNRQFKRQFGNRNFAWRGREVLLRNIRLIDE